MIYLKKNSKGELSINIEKKVSSSGITHWLHLTWWHLTKQKVFFTFKTIAVFAQKFNNLLGRHRPVEMVPLGEDEVDTNI